MDKKRNKITVIGIDGATFRIIKPLIKKGRLPNISALIKNGVHGILWSTVPTVSPVAWTSFMTGNNPGKHTIYDFLGKTSEHKFKILSALDRTSKPLWIILSEYGKRVCVAGVTLTYPTDVVNGQMVAGLGTPLNTGCIFTHPEELTSEIIEKLGPYHIFPKERPNVNTSSGRDIFIRSTDELIEYRYRLFKYLMDKEDHDFRMFFFIDTDGVSHNFWKYMDLDFKNDLPNCREKHSGAIFRVYEKVDEAIGKLIASSDKDMNFILMSDHGFGPLTRTVSLNKWLESKGLLAFRKEWLVGNVYKVFKRVASRFRKKKSILEADFNTSMIDWENTSAYFSGTVGNIFINLKGREPHGIVKPEDYDTVRRCIFAELMDITDPKTGQKIVEKVYMKEDVFIGDDLTSAPDLVVTFKSGYGVFNGKTEGRSGKGLIIEDSSSWSGDHEPDGIFIASGPAFKSNTTIPGANIIDLAPTILYLSGVPVPDSMDGKIMTDAIDSNYLNSNIISYSKSDTRDKGDQSKDGYTEEESKNVLNHLKQLGYID
ncbi:MAG: alkaline phosphatase family protein [Deltaproteobacteria bacterium]|nr:alkaline phosphatase family protein [Deltaproteobacteria bacterium]